MSTQIVSFLSIFSNMIQGIKTLLSLSETMEDDKPPDLHSICEI